MAIFTKSWQSAQIHLLYGCECCPYQGIEIPISSKKSPQSMFEPIECECGGFLRAHIEDWPGEDNEKVVVTQYSPDKKSQRDVALLKITKGWKIPREITFWRASCPECRKTITFKNRSLATCYNCQKQFELDYNREKELFEIMEYETRTQVSKKTISGYQLFMKEKSSKKGKYMTVPDDLLQWGAEWRNFSNEEKNEWNEKAKNILIC